MSKNRLYVDVHVLQTVPPSCINRDDTGSPKTAIYGGVTRARVSSQAWKKAMRAMFSEELFEPEELGLRTKRIAAMVANEITGKNPSCAGSDAEQLAKKVLIAAGLQSKSVDAGKDAPLFFMSPAQANALARLAVDAQFDDKDKKAAQNALKSHPAIDVALFGRMVADDPNLNADASAQVAHAISTHRATGEYDYFTAVDDFPDENKDNAGAGMIGTVEFNSSTLYRYATVAAHDLYRQLGGDTAYTAKAVCAFVEAFMRSMPTGKQNTFANRTLPDAALVTIRRDQPVNFAGAFEKPVKAGDGGYFDGSAKQLIKKVNETKIWLKDPEKSFVVGTHLSGLGDESTLPELLSELEGYINEHVAH